MRPIVWAMNVTAASLVVAAACDSGTGGERIELSLRALSVPSGAEPLGSFTTDEGWEVVLSEARLVLGGTYLFSTDAHRPNAFASLLLPSVARAHGGVDPLSGRTVLAERLGPITLDLLAAEPADLGVVAGIAGASDAAEIRFGATTGGAHHAVFTGVAIKDATTVEFEGSFDLEDTGTRRRVEGIAIEAELADGDAVTLAIHAETFFRGVAFDSLPVGDPVTGIAPGSQAYEAVLLGLRNGASYRFSVESGVEP